MCTSVIQGCCCSYSKGGTSYDNQKSSLEENAILIKELERQQQVIKEMQQDHKFDCEHVMAVSPLLCDYVTSS